MRVSLVACLPVLAAASPHAAAARALAKELDVLTEVLSSEPDTRLYPRTN